MIRKITDVSKKINRLRQSKGINTSLIKEFNFYVMGWLQDKNITPMDFCVIVGNTLCTSCVLNELTEDEFKNLLNHLIGIFQFMQKNLNEFIEKEKNER